MPISFSHLLCGMIREGQLGKGTVSSPSQFCVEGAFPSDLWSSSRCSRLSDADLFQVVLETVNMTHSIFCHQFLEDPELVMWAAGHQSFSYTQCWHTESIHRGTSRKQAILPYTPVNAPEYRESLIPYCCQGAWVQLNKTPEQYMLEGIV